MKKLSCLLMLLLSSCASGYYAQAQGVVPATQYVSPTAQPSATIIQSATIDYQQTAIVAQGQANIAQSTADEARRINAMATAEYIELVNEQLRMTAVVEQQEFTVLSWTQTAAVTSMPLTQTQQVIANTQTAKQQAILSGQLTATKEAPTLAMAMIDAENAKQFGEMEHVGKIVATWALIIFMVIFAAWLYYRWNQEERQLRILEQQEPEQVETPKETVVQMRTSKGGSDFSQTRLEIPCTPEQLTEFAEAITQGKKTMAINQWEGAGTSFTRPVILQVRSWARENGFAMATEDNQLAPTNDFLDFLMRWLDNQKLPGEYEFRAEGQVPHSPETAPVENYADFTGKPLITMRNHTYEPEGEGA